MILFVPWYHAFRGIDSLGSPCEMREFTLRKDIFGTHGPALRNRLGARSTSFCLDAFQAKNAIILRGFSTQGKLCAILRLRLEDRSKGLGAQAALSLLPRGANVAKSGHLNALGNGKRRWIPPVAQTRSRVSREPDLCRVHGVDSEGCEPSAGG